ncbi:hypothetical protein M8998_06195 [Sphingobacterium sp. lm-10]|uniref:hypothetical protein n=1 Tax=Sphingobacterium sp. lm-10 TaxID=2944904 RepID=UPI002022754B|nr:hypothetical protein [Sphingobacterium sp. lm-10]MCL7987523.1 hypothetical protein [Sphingobacterium sp. lm-10]
MKNSFCVLYLAAAFIVSGCSSIYQPNVPATPMFANQGEVYAAAHANIKGNASGNLAVAVGKHVAVMANGSYVDNTSGNQEYKQYMYEGGLGYFTSFGKNSDRIFELYAGYGLGNARDADTRATTTGMAPTEIREMDFEKIFVQANISRKREDVRLFGRSREFSYGTAIRGSFIRMKDFWIDGLPSPPEENLFIEPIFYTRMQLNKSFQLQYTNGFNIGVVDNNFLKAGNAVFSLGLIYKFSK